MSMLCLKKEESWKFTCDGCKTVKVTSGEKRIVPDGWIEIFIGDVHVECHRFVVSNEHVVDTSGAVFGGNAYNNVEQCYYSHDDSMLHACSESCLIKAWENKTSTLIKRIGNLRQ